EELVAPAQELAIAGQVVRAERGGEENVRISGPQARVVGEVHRVGPGGIGVLPNGEVDEFLGEIRRGRVESVVQRRFEGERGGTAARVVRLSQVAWQVDAPDLVELGEI